jgi:hypothetical protein
VDEWYEKLRRRARQLRAVDVDAAGSGTTGERREEEERRSTEESEGEVETTERVYAESAPGRRGMHGTNKWLYPPETPPRDTSRHVKSSECRGDTNI